MANSYTAAYNALTAFPSLKDPYRMASVERASSLINFMPNTEAMNPHALIEEFEAHRDGYVKVGRDEEWEATVICNGHFVTGKGDDTETGLLDAVQIALLRYFRGEYDGTSRKSFYR